MRPPDRRWRRTTAGPTHEALRSAAGSDGERSGSGSRATLAPVDAVTIENIPPEVRETLAREAEAAGESLEAYLRRTLIERAERRARAPWPEFIDRFVAEVADLPPPDEGANDDFLRGVREPAHRWIPDFDAFTADDASERRRV